LDKLSLLNLNNNFVFFYLNEYFFPRIGIIGISSIFLSYFCYKSDKNLFLILIIWIFSIFFISTILFSIVLLSHFPNIKSLTEIIREFSWGIFPFSYNDMRHWFTRTWYYTIPAFSILMTIALKEIIKKLKHSRIFKKKIIIGNLTKNICISFFISLSFTNLMTAGLYWQNLSYNIKDEEAQVIGWVSENIPDHSRILIDAEIGQHLIRTLDYNIYDLMGTAERVYKLYTNNTTSLWQITYSYDQNCLINMVNEFDGKQNVLKLEDNSTSGNITLFFNFNLPQTHGTIEYLIYSTNAFKTLWGELSDRSIDGLHIWDGNFSYYDGNNYIRLHPIEDNKWYEIKLEFECSDGGYQGLNKYEWRVTINGNVYSNLKMFRENPELTSLEFNTGLSQSGWIVYLDIIDISWVENFRLEDYFSEASFLNNFILRSNIYYIHTLLDTWYIRNFEREYFNIQDFIDYYFPTKIYEYGHLSVYKRNEPIV